MVSRRVSQRILSRSEPGSGVGAAQRYWRMHDPIEKKKVARSEVIYASHSTGSTEGAHT